MGGETRADPLQVLVCHEIVDERVGGRPVTVTFCPLCYAAIAFDRRLKGGVPGFGTTGLPRKSEPVMYDRQAGSWWRQFTTRRADRDSRDPRRPVTPWPCCRCSTASST